MLTNRLAIACVLMLSAPCLLRAIEAEEAAVSLTKVKEQGRARSRFMQEVDKTAVFAAQPEANLAEFRDKVGAILKKSCLECHGPDLSEGRLRVDQLNPDLLHGPDAQRWREVFNAIGKAEMPPENEANDRLSDADRGLVMDWLGAELKKASIVHRNRREHSSFRRLTNYEYDYALRDLLGLNYPLANRLPPESSSDDGFQNSSELLQMTPSQFETYREIGLNALRKAVVIGERPTPVSYVISMRSEWDQVRSTKGAQTFDAKEPRSKKHKNLQYLWNRETGEAIAFSTMKSLPQDEAVFGDSPKISSIVAVLPPGSEQNPPRSPELKIDLGRFLPDEGPMRVRMRVGRSSLKPAEYASLRLLFSAHTSNNANFSQVMSERDIPVTATSDDPQWIHFDIPLSEIQRNPFRKLTTTFPRRDEFLHIRNISNAASGDERLNLTIDHLEITAPFYETWPPKTHTDIFFASANQGDEHLYAGEILERFLRRVWRRPVAKREVDQYLTLFEKYRPTFTGFEETMLEVLATALASPEFLYLTQAAAPDDAKSPSLISEPELANRLAVFLWSSMPDEELLKLAEQGKLREPGVLEAQVARMLADPRSERFSRHFVTQWLGLDRLKSVNHLSDFTLKEALEEEPIAFFNEVLRNNLDIMDFIHSDYVVINERLAKHYQIPQVFGPHFRKVPITSSSNRGGLLTCASFLAMNSDGKDSHPLKRGVWLLERILHDPPPPPPPNVPEVDLTDPKILQMTLKERIADHRNKAACASCHARIDPWGIAFENYDAFGSFRIHINKQPVDATAELFNRRKIEGTEGLKRYLLSDRQDQFAEAMVHKLTVYALGRPLTLGDRSDLERTTAEFRRSDDRLGDLIRLIIRGPLFNSR